ncbi:MAG TPA: hypothetical protein VM925_34680, partial [Labilithrix sp.]|nr:hypothetical protein [Labilithrix sp.]
MRKVVSFLVPVSLLAGAMFACEDDSSGLGGPTFQLDASPGFDSGQPATIDGSLPEAAPDAPPAPPAVTITVVDGKGPKANLRVVFDDAAGAVLETKLTGADGKAKSTGALPAMASALLGTSGNRHIVTWTALENGDELVVRDLEPDDYLGTFDVTLPGAFTDAGATGYDIRAPGNCGTFAEGTVGTIDLYRSCVRAQSSVLARAHDENNQIVGHSFKKANAVPTDGGAVAVATNEWKTPTTLTLTATNIPGGGEGYVGVELLEISDGDGFLNPSASSLQGTETTFALANGFADALQASLSVFPESLGSRQILTKRFDPAASVAFDLQTVLPAITG